VSAGLIPALHPNALDRPRQVKPKVETIPVPPPRRRSHTIIRDGKIGEEGSGHARREAGRQTVRFLRFYESHSNNPGGESCSP
jgi:hypothetical protein